MDEAIDEELKLGELMRNDISRELDALQTVSSSLLMLDLKRKRIESHFDSLAKMIERKRDEAIEEIRVREEEAKLEEERRLEELKLKEVRVESLRNGVFGEIFLRSKGIDVEMRKLERLETRLREKEAEIERLVAEFKVKEKEMVEAKMDVERLCLELIGKDRAIVGLKKAVDEVEGRMNAESERCDVECRKLADENLALRGEVKLLNEKLELKSKLPGREEQLEAIQKFLNVLKSEGIIDIRNPIKDSELSGKELFITVRDSINDQGAAIAKVSSLLLKAKEKAPELVVEALIISYLSESEEKNNQSLLGPGRILLLEQLGHICPQAKSQARKEALKVAGEWSAQLKSCALKPVEISRFLQFLSMYDIIPEFSDEVLLPMLHCIAVHEGTPDFCLTLGFSDRITECIKSMIAKNQRLKALDIVTTFKMEKEFSVVKIIQGHLKGLKKNCQRIFKKGEDRKAAEVQVLDLQINTLKELIKCIKDLKLQSIYKTGNLEERVAKLKRQKYISKRPAPCSDPSSDPELPRKKGCRRTGTDNTPEVIPCVSNTSPDIGSSDILCSRPISDSYLLGTIRTLPEMVKSAVLTPNASDANAEVRSGVLLRSKCNSHPEPQRNNKRKRPGTPKPIEVAQNTSNSSPETGSRVSSKFNSDPEPLRSKGCNFPGTAKLKEAASNASPETGSRYAVSSKSNSDPEPLRSKGCNFRETAKLKEAASNTSNASPETGSRYVLSSKSNSDPEPLSKECNLPGTAKLTEAASDTSNASPETGSRDLVNSKFNSDLEPLRSKGCDFPGTAKLKEAASNTSNAFPETGSRYVVSSKSDSDPESLSKGCDLLGTAKLTEAASPETGSRDVVNSKFNSDPEPLRSKGCNFPGTAKLKETASNTSNASPETGSRYAVSSKSNGDSKPVRSKGCDLLGTAKLTEAASNTSNASPETGSRDVVNSKFNSDPEPLRIKGCILPGTATAKLKEAATKTSKDSLCLKSNISPKPLRNTGCNLSGPAKPQDIVPKGTLNAYPEIRSEDVLSSNLNSFSQPVRKMECKLPDTTKSMERAQNTSNAIPETGSSYPGPLRYKGYDLPGTAKLREVVLNTSNAYPKIDSRDALCSNPNTNPVPWRNKSHNVPEPAKPQEIAPEGNLNACTEIKSKNTLHSREMQKASFYYDPLPFRYDVPAGSPCSNIPSRTSGYQPPLPTRTPQYYHPCPRLEGNHEHHAPSWQYSVPNRPPYLDAPSWPYSVPNRPPYFDFRR